MVETWELPINSWGILGVNHQIKGRVTHQRMRKFGIYIAIYEHLRFRVKTNGDLPSGNLTWLWTVTIFNGFISFVNGQFSVAILNYWGVDGVGQLCQLCSVSVVSGFSPIAILRHGRDT